MNMELNYNYNDGGRSNYFTGTAGDCVVRAIAIASRMDYKEVYDIAKHVLGYTPRDGVSKEDSRKLIAHFGGTWIPVMKIGTGCHCHLAQNEVPMKGRIICCVTGHVTAVIDGVINDTYNPSREGTRCVYGYWDFGH